MFRNTYLKLLTLTDVNDNFSTLVQSAITQTRALIQRVMTLLMCHFFCKLHKANFRALFPKLLLNIVY